MNRKSHSYHVLDDADVYSACLRLGTHFEVCPTSSVMTGSVRLSDRGHHHPASQMVSDGANFGVSRDDSAITMTTMEDELEVVRGWAGFKGRKIDMVAVSGDTLALSSHV